MSPTPCSEGPFLHSEILGLVLTAALGASFFLCMPCPTSSGVAKTFQWGLGSWEACCKILPSPGRSDLGTATLPRGKVTDRPLLMISLREKETIFRHNLKYVSWGKRGRTHSGRIGHFLLPQSEFFYSSRKWSGIHTINYASCLPNELSCRDSHVQDQKNVISPW